MALAPISRQSWSNDGELRHTVRARCRIDPDTVKALREAAKTDDVLVGVEAVVNYCLKLGIEVYLQNAPSRAARQETGQ